MMTVNLSLSEILANLERRIETLREQVGLHARQEEHHREQRALLEAELQKAMEHFESFREVAGKAADLDLPAAAPALLPSWRLSTLLRRRVRFIPEDETTKNGKCLENVILESASTNTRHLLVPRLHLPLLVEIFRSALQSADGWLEIAEALPDPEGMPRDGGGRSWAVEVQLESWAFSLPCELRNDRLALLPPPLSRRPRPASAGARPPPRGLPSCGGQIDHFFFVRFLLRGPHIRLQLRPRPDPAGTLGYDVAAAAEAFFAVRPSRASLPEEEIRRRNRLILARAPHENDDAVYPDNFLREVPFRPETERYGGPDLLGPSLDFFTLSSVSALRFLEAYGGEPRARQLSEIFRLLARQALGFARTPEELQHLLQAPVESWGEPMAPAADPADQLYDRHRQDLLGLLGAEVESLASPETEAARRLAREIGNAPEDVRRRICTSQLHMTANRLGIEGAEEVYLARLLWKSARELAESAPDLWRRLGTALQRAPGWGPGSMVACATCSTRLSTLAR